MSHYPQTFVLTHPLARKNALEAVQKAADGFAVIVREPVRHEIQNNRMWALIADIVKAKAQFAGRTWGKDDWKEIFFSGFCKAKWGAADPVIGMEGEVLFVRGKQTSGLNVRDMSDLLMYIEVWMARNGVPIMDTAHGEAA
jgi:hypothetical protein